MSEIDVTGRIYFASIFPIVMKAYEDCLAARWKSAADLFGKTDFALPIVHAEADYLGPLELGDAVEIQMEVETIGRTSFQVRFRVFRIEKGKKRGGKSSLASEPSAVVHSVHVWMDRRTGKKSPLPADLRKALEKLIPKSASPRAR